MALAGLDELVADGRQNAIAAWLLVGLASAVWVGEVIVSEFLWSVFALVVLVLAVLPPIVYRSRWVMLPWEVLALAALPLIGLAVGTQRFASPLFAYLAVAAVALVIVVELDTFTGVRLSPAFAVGLVVVATMAAAAAWELLQWYAAIALDRPYDRTNDQLMFEFLYSMLAGLGAGVLFRAYFRRRGSTPARVPPDVDVSLGDAIDPASDGDHPDEPTDSDHRDEPTDGDRPGGETGATETGGGR